ncbi:MAG: hypothetical protein ABSF33_01235 [Acidimicrobiales bacterium]
MTVRDLADRTVEELGADPPRPDSLVRAPLTAPAVPRRHWIRAHPGLLVVAALPILVFGGFAASGHVLMEADNLIQNFPLRALVGVDLRHGQLPLWNPYVAGGTALLGGFNAGAAYPGTWLFAVLPAQGAWVVNVILVYEVALFGMFVFLRRQTLSKRASTLGAATFMLGGFMSAQFVHIDLIQGAAWLPWVLLALDGMFATSLDIGLARDLGATAGGGGGPLRTARLQRIRFTALLAVSFGLSILAGAPEAFMDGGVLAVIYAVWLLRRLPKGRRVPYLTAIAAGMVGALMLGAAQWLPGWAFSHLSQRAVPNYAFFTSGSWPIRLTTLLFSPFLMGTNLQHPSFWFGPFTFPEMAGYVGVIGVIAAFALLGRRWRRHESARLWRVWYVVLALGLLLAWGGHTPVGRLEYLIPFLNQQRLLNRNLLIVDVALVVLLSWWVDLALLRRGDGGADRVPAVDGDGAAGGPRAPSPGHRPRTRYERLAVALPIGLVVLLAVAEWASVTPWLADGLPRFIGDQFRVSRGDLITPAVLATLAAIFAVAIGGLARYGHRLTAARTARLTAVVMVADLLVFNLFVLRPPVPPTVVTQSGALATQLAAVTGTGSRFAVYDPDLYDYDQLLSLGHDDLNVLRRLPTVEDYTALVAKSYFEATGAHGQDELAPGVFSTPVVDQLNLGVLLSLPSYFMSPVDPARSRLPVPRPDTEQPVAPGGDQRVDVSPGSTHTWFTGGTADLRAILLISSHQAAPATMERLSALEIGVVTVGGSIRWLADGSTAPRGTGGSGVRSVSLPSATPVAGIVVRNPGKAAVTLDAPRLDTADFGLVDLKGVLQNQVQSPRWRYAMMIGPFAVFKNTASQGWAWLTAPRADPADKGPPAPKAGADAAGPFGAVTRTSTTPWGTDSYLVDATRSARMIRSESYLRGWSATLTPVDGAGKPIGPTTHLPVGRSGILQTVAVPAGRSMVTFVYRPKLALIGLALSTLATIVAGLVLLVTWRRLRADPDRPRSEGTIR